YSNSSLTSSPMRCCSSPQRGQCVFSGSSVTVSVSIVAGNGCEMAASIYVSPFWPALLLRAPLGSPAQGFSLVPEHRRPTVPAALLVRQTRVRLWNQTAAVSVPRYRLWPRPAGLALPSALPPVGTSL